MKLQSFGHVMRRADSLEKTLMLGKLRADGEGGNRLSGHEFEQTPGDNEEQGSLACCSPWAGKESDMT